MKYKIDGKEYAILKVTLEDDEIFAEAGAMLLMKGEVKVKTISYDGIVKGILRKIFAGESVFLNKYWGRGEVWLAPGLPGEITTIDLKGKCWILQDYSYLAHYGDVEFNLAWKGLKGFFAGGEAIWLKACGEGLVWVSAYGQLEWIDVEDEIIIDNMHFVALPDDVEWEVKKIGDLKTTVLSGEGYVVKVRGKTRILIQSRILPPLAASLMRFMPNRFLDLLRYRI